MPKKIVTEADIASNDSKLTLKSDGVDEQLTIEALPSPMVENSDGTTPLAPAVHTLRNPAADFGLQYDIGNFVGARPDDHTVVGLLECHWMPPQGYSFPFSEHNKGQTVERRYVRSDHLLKYPWLVVSDAKAGLFCKFCPLFATGHIGGKHKTVALQALVTEPLKKFAKLLGKDGALETHSKARYHIEAVEAGKAFLKTCRDPARVVANQIDTQRMRQVSENRARLLSIVDNVVFLARQNIAFRGHRDDGPVVTGKNGNDSSENGGNFKELLRFRVKCGDHALEKHLSTATGRKMFTSKTTQNALIECCGDEVLSVILARVRQSKYYGIMFDETTDVAHKSQLSLVLRYEHDLKIREDFVGFLDPRELKPQDSNQNQNSSMSDSGSDEEEQDEDDALEPTLTGTKLGKIVLSLLRSLSLDPKGCVGIATDGCSVMTSELCGAIQEIQKVAVHAVRCPCFNHSLNLSISKTSTVQSVRNTTGTMREVIAFFTASPKRNAVLKLQLGKQLTKLCDTRWVERHDAVLQFRESLGSIAKALETVSQWREPSSAAKARSLLTSILDAEFVIATLALYDVLSVTLPLSRLLQKPDLEMNSASDIVKDTIVVLSEKRNPLNVEKTFKEIFAHAEEIAENMGAQLDVPRLVQRQMNCAKLPPQTAESYFRAHVYIPLVESVVEDLKQRFPEEVLEVYSLNTLLPRHVNEKGAPGKLSILAAKYGVLLGMGDVAFQTIIRAEFSLWAAKWRREQEKGPLPSTAVETLQESEPELYPNIRTLLRVLATLPVSVATAERSFSTLRRIKTWIRSRCGEKRLNGLALLHVHRDVNVDQEKVVDRYAQGARRRKAMFVL